MNMQLHVAESSSKGGEWHLVAWLVRDLFFPVNETYFELKDGFALHSDKQKAKGSQPRQTATKRSAPKDGQQSKPAKRRKE